MIDIKEKIDKGFIKTKLAFGLALISFGLMFIFPTAFWGFLVFEIIGSFQMGATLTRHFGYEEKTPQEIRKFVHKAGIIAIAASIAGLVLEHFGLGIFAILTGGITGCAMGAVIVAFVYEKKFR